MKIVTNIKIFAFGFLSLALLACTAERRASIDLSDSSLVSADELHLGSHEFPISTKSTEAQLAFNRGINLMYGFNHAASESEFRRAAELDPETPMPWWGIALVNGPHINYPLLPENKAKIAWDALIKAKARSANGSEMEKALINALSERYVQDSNPDRVKLDEAYAAAMEKVYHKYPTNADVVSLYAESLMDLHPWDMWQINGQAKPWTPKIVATIERALDLNANHPLANHLYIHAVEASQNPEKGVPSADRLMTLVPAAGHLLHMPAHIYIRVGRWEDAAIANQRAVIADNVFRNSSPKLGFYALYMAHSHHFLSFVRMMQGQYRPAMSAARAMLAGVPQEFLQEFGPIADGYFAIALEVMVRFGKWNEILAEPAPPEEFPLARALWRFSRATALTALDRPEDAQAERAMFLEAVKKVPADATFGNNQAHTILKIAKLVLDGEIAARAKNFDAAISLLKEAVKIEDSLTYDEPPDWILPVRHSLGITLLRAGKPKVAEVMYLQDLKKFPNNGWSLYGMSRALSMQGKKSEAAEMMAKFKDAWKNSDIEISGSCLCQPGV